MEKTGGGHLRGGLYAHARSPGLEMNDMGFERSTDWLLQGMWVGWHHFEPGKVFRNWNANFNAKPRGREPVRERERLGGRSRRTYLQYNRRASFK